MNGTIQQILQQKGSDVVSVHPKMLLDECARLMKERGIGSLLVCENEDLIGILHERDICRRPVCKGMDLAATSVSDIMDTEFAVVSSRSTVMDAMAIINAQRVRHLPVIDDGGVVGLVSIGDLTKWILSLQKNDIQHLIDYISGTEHPDHKNKDASDNENLF